MRGNKNKQLDEKVTRHNNSIINRDSFEHMRIFNPQYCKLTCSVKGLVLISDTFDLIFAENLIKVIRFS